MTQQTIQVDGMTCGHCAETISNEVGALEGVQKVSVNLEAKNVAVDFDESKIDLKSISSKIVEAGFEVSDN